jgi:peptidoglycan/LPS O-acetylase OafA/YrhL
MVKSPAASQFMPSEPTQLQPPDYLAALDSKLRRATIPSLNGLRALAILLVFFVHAQVTQQTGILGVEGFFVLSGFLITWKLLDESEATGTVSIRGFYWRRVLRIFPAFYGYWLIGIGQILVRHGSVPWADAMAAFFYVSNYYQGLKSSLSPFMLHTWSLSVEEQFYLLWPTLFVAFRRRLGRLTSMLAVLVVCVWIYRAILSYFGSDWLQWYIFTAFETRVDQLAIGCLLAITLRRKALRGFWKFVCSKPHYALVTAATIALSEQFVDNVVYRNAISFIIDPVLCAVLLAQAVAFSDTALWSWLNFPVLSWIGKLSYSIYLYHELALAIGKRLMVNAPYLELLVSVILTLAFSSASYYWIERPFLRLKRKVHALA